MPRVTFLVTLVLLIPLRSFAEISHENSGESSHELNNTNLRLSVGTNSFRHVNSEESVEAASARADGKDGVVSAETGDERQTLSAHAVARTIQAAMEDMLSVQTNSQKLRESIQRLGLDLGVMRDKEQEAANELKKRRTAALNHLSGLALESGQLRSEADALSAQLYAQYMRLSDTDEQEQLSRETHNNLQNLGHTFAATQEFAEYEHQDPSGASDPTHMSPSDPPHISSENSPSQKSSAESSPDPNSHELDQQKRAAEDAKFAQLEQETMKIQRWFRQLKQIKQAKDALRQRKLEAAKAAQDLGLSHDEIADRLQRVEDAEHAGKLGPHVSDAKHAGNHAEVKAASALLQVEQSQTLGAVLARSSSEMETIEGTAQEVMSGIQAFDAWKRLGNDSQQSLVLGLITKEKLQKRLEALNQNEKALSDRINQLHHFMGTSPQ